jgi:hypothetical protein
MSEHQYHDRKAQMIILSKGGDSDQYIRFLGLLLLQLLLKLMKIICYGPQREIICVSTEEIVR